MIRRFRFLFAASTVLSGCIQEYRPPTADEPHAIVKFRRSYEQVAGTSLRETVDIGEFRALEATNPSAVGRAGRIDAILVHPTPATLQIDARFFHTENRMVQESYVVRTPHYETETYNCGSGFGTNATYRTCTRPVTRYTSETKYRMVLKPVDVTDGTCGRALGFSPMNGRVYLIEYTYQSPGACSMSCFEQTPGPNGELHNQPCAHGPIVAARE